MPLGTELGFGPDDIVLDGDPAPPKRGTAVNFRPMSTVAKRLDGWRCHLLWSPEVGLDPGDVVLDGDPAPPPKAAQEPAPFSADMSIVAKRSPISAIAELSY